MTAAPRQRVLVVDDDPASRELLATALRDDYEVATAGDGYAAISMAAEWLPDLVLLDVMMPGLDGLQVCRVLRAESPTADIPILFVTAVDSPQGERAGLELGAVDYLTKPLDLGLARLRIHNHLELRRQRQLVRQQNAELQQQKAALEATLRRLKRLEGIVSLCMHCKKVRTADNAWQQLERYLTEHTDARFSHGICPECRARHWPE